MRRLVAGVGLGWAVVVAAMLPVSAQNIQDPSNKHNLAVTSNNTIESTTQTEICIFCHAPHQTLQTMPLWTQTLSTTASTAYSSTTMAASPGAPTGSSKLCLSCHDGTVAIGSTTSGNFPMSGLTGGKLTNASKIGTALGDDHPISFVPITGSHIVDPPNGSSVKLDTTGQVQCVTCHDSHQMDIDATTKKFLVMSNAGSAMCLVCHQQAYWSSNPSTHKTSTKSFAAAEGAHTGYTTVADNGCESCHKPHTAGASARTLKSVEEGNCTPCHGSSGVAKNIQAEYQKTYRHPTYSTTPSVHEETESPSNVSHTLPETSAATARHAECEDCHNPHASYQANATPPKASGMLAGVWGISRTGAVVQPTGTPPSVNEYEICFKCHADSANLPESGGQPYPPYPVRQVSQFNKRIQFDTTAVSYHPIEQAAPSTASGYSLTTPANWTAQGLTMTRTSIIRCNDCHDNDSGPNGATPGTGPAGTHGSSQKHILAGEYDMDNRTYTESAAAYALCYKCHDRTKVMSSSSWTEHSRHVQGQGTPCSVCHEPHGIGSTGTTTNNAHLINFDTRTVGGQQLVAPYNGVINYTRTGTQRGTCTMVCHASRDTRTHIAQVYPN